MSISSASQDHHATAPEPDPHLDALIETAARRPLERALSSEFNSSLEGLAAVIVCDLDRFRLVNEALGYEAGDALVRMVARRLQDAMGAAGRLAWIGGDQFMLVSSSVRSSAELDAVVERLRAAIEVPAQLRGRLVYPTATFGRAWRCLGSGDDRGIGAELMRLAEADMHRGKVRSRSASASQGGETLLRLDTDLHGAAERGELLAHFQPLYEVRTGALVAFEVLARWAHPRLGLIGPDVFIPIAEDNGLIHEVGAHMLRAARRFLSGTDIPGVSLYVNVSTKQLTRVGFADDVPRIFCGDDLLLGRLTLEVTESSLILDLDRVLSELTALRRRGVGVAVDDFGSGYSSLVQLQELPVTELKIDRALVQRAGAVGRAVLRAVVHLARDLDLRVIAEGVEQTEQLRFLDEVGCDRVQGFLFSPALPAHQAHELPPTLATHAVPDGTHQEEGDTAA